MKPRINTRLMSTLTMAATLVGCGMFSTKNKAQKSRENDNELAGQWRDSCSKVDWFGFSYQRETLNFSVVGDFDKITTLYGDADCAQSMGTLSEHGTYASLGASSVVASARDINFTITKAEITADSDDAVKLLNDVSYCGISAWEKGHTTDVLGKSCAGVSHPKGEVIFDVYRVENDGKRLETGKGSLFVDKSDANSRPSKLDKEHVYTKQ